MFTLIVQIWPIKGEFRAIQYPDTNALSVWIQDFEIRSLPPAISEEKIAIEETTK